MIFYLVCCAWLLVSLLTAPVVGKSIRLRDQGGPR